MITLYQFHRLWGIANASPFCMKLETYLRMAKLSYKVKYIDNPRQAPKGKLPYLQIDELVFADSELIIDELKQRFGDPLDKELTPQQKALGHLIETSFNEQLYWIILFFRWQNNEGWKRVKEDFFSRLPTFPKLFVPYLVRKQMLDALYAQGMGRHNKEEILHLGTKTIEAMVEFLGTNAYFLGDKASTVDATAFAFLANILFPPMKTPLQELLLSKENIVAYCARMKNNFYPDFQ
ncbi:glutathione S-transferase family protein [Legionella sp. km772]|uniref:glutathione S-transferase family protein n=1 Tax=Legionella sp. km772 TaxID=2498111 RepID=UPI000F8E5941|nr:glutathione S-transferase family protein [Legionella sp. km772]RUR06389.1 glutathione S-transferase family protein [Legionella sp. km772]